MHSLTIVFGPAATAWTLLFKSKETADLAYRNIPSADVTDDFGQTVRLSHEVIHGMMLEDMDLSQLAAIERGLHQARTQAKAETKAMTDETIKAAMRAKQQGPSVYQPGMPMGPNGRMM